MLKPGMYVRCPIDSEDMEHPRDFAIAKIKQIDEMANKAKVAFHDLYHISKFYHVPTEYEYPLRKLVHAQIHRDAIVRYSQAEYRVRACANPKEEGAYSYYITALHKNETLLVSEEELNASFTDGEVNPYVQMVRYEFQQPVWYFGRCNVSRTMRTIENSIYGFKELSGCKIFLKPYQLKTVMRCLQQKPCRNMIADEVGLGKTIEAASVLKIFMTDQKKANIVILVPDALVEQWKTELAFKFQIFTKADRNDNRLMILPFSRIPTMKTELSHDFLIVDEVHQCLRSRLLYDRILELSTHAKNVLMLSATPVQDRKDEYYRLLKLIQPVKYGCISKVDFEQKIGQQERIVRCVYELLGSLEDYQDEIDAADGELSDEAQDIYEDELAENFEKLGKTITDKRFDAMVQSIDIEADDHGIPAMQTAAAYVCENYQLEQCIIRNRRSVLDEDSVNERQMHKLPFDLNVPYNNTQLLIYRRLSEYLEENVHSVDAFKKTGLPLITALFSSASAFESEIKKNLVNEEISLLAQKWKNEESRELEKIKYFADDPYEHPTRLIQILDYIDQEAADKKVLLFTAFPETFAVYRKAFAALFRGKCCYFQKGMSADELELQTYRFQTDAKYQIMLSDETGGEGRNFQKADILIHIDLPWNANTLEQRIGRLDRIGRSVGRPVLSVVPYAEDTLEEDLVKVWAEGLRIFEQSQSGLEIIMNEIDEKIIEGVSSNMKYGLANMVPQLMEDVSRLKETVKKEQHFDVAAYRYLTLNQQLDRSVRLYAENETDLFTSSMLSWANLTGFVGKNIAENVTLFTKNSFSPGSAKHTLFIPPDMKAEIDSQINQIQNHVREMNGERSIETDSNYIQGTFSRNKALSNDYLHFFAPGDSIFDSIVQNALYSYKGRSAAFVMPASFNWEGLIFTWQLNPNEVILLKNGIDIRMLNPYRGYLPGQQLMNIIPANESFDTDSEAVLREFRIFAKTRLSSIPKLTEHLGKRKPKSPILGIKEKYGCSDLEWFQRVHPRDKWGYFVQESYKQAKAAAWEELKKMAKIKELKADLLGSITNQKAAMTYFSQDASLQETERIHRLLLDAFLNSKVELDSVCYVRMVKSL